MVWQTEERFAPPTQYVINLVSDASVRSHTIPLFWEKMRELGMEHCATGHWATDVSPTAEDGELLGSTGGEGHEWLMLYESESGEDSEQVLVRYYYSSKYLAAWVATHSQVLADQFIAQLKEKHPEPVVRESTIPVTFWYQTQHGPKQVYRTLDNVADWDALKGNYAANVRDELDWLMQYTPGDTSSGQLIVMQGDPGGGKTYVTQSLVKAWKEWAHAVYITDTDAFFKDTSYMMECLLESENGDKWTLVILEDAGELLTKDARHEVGQALSRLLNVADGMVGKGLKVMLLLTTNEQDGALHEAVTRNGRCLSQLVFQPLSRTEVQEWCAAHDVPMPDMASTGTMALADLYALANPTKGRKTKTRERRPIGFAVHRNGHAVAAL